MTKVFIAHESPVIDYSPSARFGPSRPVFGPHSGPSGLRNPDTRSEMMARVSGAAATFEPKEDFLLMSGNPILMGIVFHKFFAKAGYVRCLQWDRYASKYTIFEVTEEK